MKTEDLVETTCSEASGDELPQLNSAVRRKIDLRLIPLVTILYLCCFLYAYLSSDSVNMVTEVLFNRDRSNLGISVSFIEFLWLS